MNERCRCVFALYIMNIIKMYAEIRFIHNNNNANEKPNEDVRDELFAFDVLCNGFLRLKQTQKTPVIMLLQLFMYILYYRSSFLHFQRKISFHFKHLIVRYMNIDMNPVVIRCELISLWMVWCFNVENSWWLFGVHRYTQKQQTYKPLIRSLLIRDLKIWKTLWRHTSTFLFQISSKQQLEVSRSWDRISRWIFFFIIIIHKHKKHWI